MADYNKLTVVKLKDELKSRGLATTGLKAALVARLDEHDAELANDQATNEDATPRQEVPLVVEAAEPQITASDAPVLEADTQPQLAQESSSVTARVTHIPQNEQLQSLERVKGDLLLVSEGVGGEPAAENTTIKSLQPEEQENVQSRPLGNAEVAEGTPREDQMEIEHANSVPPSQAQNDEHEAISDRDASVHTQGLPTVQGGAENMKEPQIVSPSPQEVEQSQDYMPSNGQLKGSQALGTPVSERPSQQPESIRAVEMIQPETQASVSMEDVVEDNRKRKRRSQSPRLSTQDAAIKKMKALDGSPRARLPEDTAEIKDTQDAHMTDAPSSIPQATSPAKPSPADARFKGLFASQMQTKQPEQSIHDLEDRDIAPAVHPATAALYIRNLQRPLPALREHLASLVQGTHTEPAVDVVTKFFLDTIKSHALVRFSSTSAASRVRLALHDKIWPNERDRRALWVDYIPEDKVKDWIDTEQASAGVKPPKRFEVVYEDEEGGVTAYLRETQSNTQRRPTAQGALNGPPIPVITKPPVIKGDPGHGFKALDDLFMSTTTKPKLYFQPVSESVKNRRLGLLAEGRGGGRSDEMRRFSFEDDSVVVDKGPEWGSGGRGERGGRGGYRGGYGGRGGFRGDSWRR